MTDPVVFYYTPVQLPIQHLGLYECSICAALIQYNGDATEKHRKYHEQCDPIKIDT